MVVMSRRTAAAAASWRPAAACMGMQVVFAVP